MFGREGMRLVLIGVAFFGCHHPAGQCPMTTSFCFPSKSTYLNVDTLQWGVCGSPTSGIRVLESETSTKFEIECSQFESHHENFEYPGDQS